MAVMTKSSKKLENQHYGTRNHQKSSSKGRPITATLERPLILNIQFLQTLDMTSFNKNGLITLLKFCGISIIKKADSKKKCNKRIISVPHTKQQLTKNYFGKVHSVDPRGHIKSKKKPAKEIPKLRSRINFKETDNVNWLEENSSDVVCKRHKNVSSPNTLAPDVKLKKPQVKKDIASKRKSITDDKSNNTMDNVIPEPCKTCTRSEHPERFHSHPKVTLAVPGGSTSPTKSPESMNLENRFKNSLTTEDRDESVEGTSKGSKERKNLSAKSKKDTVVASPKKCGSSENRPGNSPSSPIPNLRPITVFRQV